MIRSPRYHPMKGLALIAGVGILAGLIYNGTFNNLMSTPAPQNNQLAPGQHRDAGYGANFGDEYAAFDELDDAGEAQRGSEKTETLRDRPVRRMAAHVPLTLDRGPSANAVYERGFVGGIGRSIPNMHAGPVIPTRAGAVVWPR